MGGPFLDINHNGDINVGNTGVTGNELSNIFNAIAEQERLKEEQQRARKELTQRILLVGGGLVYFSVVILIIYIIYKRNNQNAK